jgi:hypothetical protein
MVAEPPATPVTRPEPLTVAVPGLSLAQVTARPVRTLPLASLSVALSWSVPLTWTLAGEGLTVTDATGAVEAIVVPVAMLDNAPNTAFTLSVPRNATSSKLYVVPAARPNTVHVRLAPTEVPARGVVHVPVLTLAVFPPQDSVLPGANRMS